MSAALLASIVEALPGLPIDRLLGVATVVFGTAPPPSPHAPSVGPTAPPKEKKPRRINRFGLQVGITQFLNGYPEGASLADIVTAMREQGRMKRSDTEQAVLSILKRNTKTYLERPDGRWVLTKFMRN